MIYVHDIPKKYKLLEAVTMDDGTYIVTKIYSNSDEDWKYQLYPVEDIFEALEIMKKRDNELKRNGSGYLDPTAYKAITNVDPESGRFHRLLNAIFTICELSDFSIEGRVVLKDKQSGKVWR